MTRVLLLRHGQSEWNALGRWQGRADPPLTDLGRHQARSVAAALGGIDAIAASTLQRAAETAAIIAAELGIGPVLIDADLQERDAGEWSGLTRAEIDEQYPGYLPTTSDGAEGNAHLAMTDDADVRRPPGWESDPSVIARATAALHRLAVEVPGGTVVAVTHGGVVYALEGSMGQPFERLPNGSGRWFDVHPDRLELGERVTLFDDSSAPSTTNRGL